MSKFSKKLLTKFFIIDIVRQTERKKNLRPQLEGKFEKVNTIQTTFSLHIVYNKSKMMSIGKIKKL